MLENRSCESCLVFTSSCQQETKWPYMTYIANNKRPREFDDESDDGQQQSKSSKLSDSSESPQASWEQSLGSLRGFHDQSDDIADSKGPMEFDSESDGCQGTKSSDLSDSSETRQGFHEQYEGDDVHVPDSHEKPADDDGVDNRLPDSPRDSGEQSADVASKKHPIGFHRESDNRPQTELVALSGTSEIRQDASEQYHADDNQPLNSSGTSPDSLEKSHNGDANNESDSLEESQEPSDDGGNQRDAGESSSDLDSLIQPLDRDTSINCLIRCSRADYCSIASLNRSFRSLIRSGEIYKLRRMNGVIEHWVYFSCHFLQWEAFDPIHRRWMHLPQMPPNECFIFSDKESLAVGTELLVFGKEVQSQVIYRYSILTNSWSSGLRMNAPRFLFGSASLGEIAILAGGCDSYGNILSTAEMYNSETQEWETLPSMNKPRKMCSGVFMDGKFYVIGGIGGIDPKVLTCGEEYDLERKKWTEIPNMSPVRNGAARENEMPVVGGAPPLVAVVNNELYAADHADMELRKYDKRQRTWITVGRLPERAASMNGWGLAFRACGDRLIVIGGPRAAGEGFIELNSWVPNEGPPQWNLLARKQSANFVYNCAVMGC